VGVQVGNPIPSPGESGCVPEPAHPARPPRFGSPPPLVLTVLAALIAGYALWLRSDAFPNVFGGLPCLAIVAAACLFVDYLIRVVRSLLRRTLRWRDGRWYIAPLLALVVVSGWTTWWPLRLRFQVSRPAFERAAADWLAKTPATQPYAETWCLNLRWDQNIRTDAGAYRDVELAVFKDERIVFFVTGGFFRAIWGFVYDPDDRALETAEDAGHDWVTRPLDGHWKTFLEERD
jgi:hypothetical protein